MRVYLGNCISADVSVDEVLEFIRRSGDQQTTGCGPRRSVAPSSSDPEPEEVRPADQVAGAMAQALMAGGRAGREAARILREGLAELVPRHTLSRSVAPASSDPEPEDFEPENPV